MSAKRSENKKVRDVNQNFVIRWALRETPTKTNLIGAGRYHTIVGTHLAEKHFDKAMTGGKYRYEFEVNRAYVITFAGK